MLPGDLFVTLFRHSAAGFAALALEGTLATRIAEQMLHHTGRRPSPGERRSWERSLPVLAQDLAQAGLDRVEVLVEHHLPLTSKRADVVLAGAHPRTGNPSYVVLELKQWSAATTWEGDPELVIVDGYGGQPKLHPVAQVRGYCTYMIDFTRSLAGSEDSVAGAAYLHNADAATAVAGMYSYPADNHGQLLIGARRGEFIEFLRSRLAADVDGAPFADQLLSSAVAPSKQLLAVAAEEVQQREQFVLLAEQQLAYSVLLHEVERARSADRKSVVIVTGGPGSGKSVIALSLLGELSRRGWTVLHATGSRSFTQTLRKVAGKRVPRVQRMFKYFNQFMDAERNSLDVSDLWTRPTASGRRPSIGTPAPSCGQGARRSTSSSPPRGFRCSCSTSTRSCVPASSALSLTSNATRTTLGFAGASHRPGRAVPLWRQRGVRAVGAAAARAHGGNA